jgi:hypothetical protein
MTASIFDLFKIGVGQSSSHIMGSIIAARCFCEMVSAVDECDTYKETSKGGLALNIVEC